jgi:hypothetical protein
MSQPTVNDDPYAVAETATPRPAAYFGQVKVDAWFAKLVKGVGKMPFDASADPMDQRVTAIDIHLLPLPECNISFEVKRELIDQSKAWASIVLPSIKALGLTGLRDLNDRFVQITTAPTGRKYSKNGEEREETTFKFVELYADEASCRAAYNAQRGSSQTEEEPLVDAAPAPVNGNGNKERETALQFLKVYVEAAARGQTDLQVIREKLAGQIAIQPVIAKYFTVDSPETMNLIMEVMAK